MELLQDLERVLAGYREQADVRRRLLELAAVGGDPFSRDHFVPGHFTASGFVLDPGGGSVLLVHHRRLDLWLQPGGHIDNEDGSIEQASRREVVEETGVRLEDASLGIVDLDVHVVPAGRGEPTHEHFDIRFLFSASDTMMDIDRNEVKDARWVALDDVIGGAGDASVRRVAAKLLARG